jgi:hypothetical protein
MLLRMGQDLTKLLTPYPAASVALDKSHSLDRPSSADWRAISTANPSTAGELGLAVLGGWCSVAGICFDRLNLSYFPRNA